MSNISNQTPDKEDKIFYHGPGLSSSNYDPTRDKLTILYQSKLIDDLQEEIYKQDQKALTWRSVAFILFGILLLANIIIFWK